MPMQVCWLRFASNGLLPFRLFQFYRKIEQSHAHGIHIIGLLCGVATIFPEGLEGSGVFEKFLPCDG